jgi:hypothetical protein
MLPVSNDAPPPVWVGHVFHAATDVAKACDFYVRIGMRRLFETEDFAVLELRAGTHMVLQKQEEPPAEDAGLSFDVMVDDIDGAWKAYEGLGLEPTEVERGKIHDCFHLRDPSGYAVKVNSSHASEYPV